MPDRSWERHLAHRWEPEAIKEVLSDVPGLSLQQEAGRQHRFKISYNYEAGVAPRRREIQKLLRERKLPVKVILSQGVFLDVIPIRSGKGQAIRYVTMKWGIPADQILFYARRGSDYEALSGQFLGVLAGDHAPELGTSRTLPRVYRAESPNFTGLLEGIDAYQFDQTIEIPQNAAGLDPEKVEESETAMAPDLIIHMNDGD